MWPACSDPAAAEPHTSLQATLREAVRRAVALHAPRDAVPPSPELTVRPPGTPHSAPEESTGRPTVPLRVMLEWLRAGRLRGRLDASSTPALRRWYEHAIAGGWASGAAPDAGLSQSEVPQADLARLARQAQEAVADIALAEPERAALLARLLVIKTPAWDLLTALLGKNPITGDEVPQTAETIIGGLMKLASVTGRQLSIPLLRYPIAEHLLLYGVGARPPPDGVR